MIVGTKISWVAVPATLVGTAVSTTLVGTSVHKIIVGTTVPLIILERKISFDFFSNNFLS